MLSRSQLAKLRRMPLGGRNKLTVAMKLAGLTQVQVGEHTGQTQSYISRIANGRYSPEGLPLETARAFAKLFGCAIEDIFPEHEAVAA